MSRHLVGDGGHKPKIYEVEYDVQKDVQKAARNRENQPRISITLNLWPMAAQKKRDLREDADRI